MIKAKNHNNMNNNMNNNSIKYDTEIVNWLGLLVGIYLYFDEKDELNFKQSSLLSEISKPFNINSFK